MQTLSEDLRSLSLCGGKSGYVSGLGLDLRQTDSTLHRLDKSSLLSGHLFQLLDASTHQQVLLGHTLCECLLLLLTAHWKDEGLVQLLVALALALSRCKL
jgi:hypothetical protein